MALIDSGHSDLVEAVVALKVGNISSALSTARKDPDNEATDGVDSGYASQSSTPDSLKSTFVDRAVASGKNIWPLSNRKPKQLRPYNKTIPQLTWDRFSDLREQYAESLNQFTRSLPGCSSVLMTLQVLGEDELSAEPWVFVQCDKSVFKKISNFFKQPLIKMDFEPPQPSDRSPRLRVLVCPRKPRMLAKEENDEFQNDILPNDDLVEVYGDESGIVFGNLHGTEIKIEDSDGMRKATLGGIIAVHDLSGVTKLFGMTAGHFLLPQLQDENVEIPPEGDMDDGFYEDDPFELDWSSLDGVGEQMGSVPSMEADDDSGKTADLNKWSKMGSVFKASHTTPQEGLNFDWALITIEHNSFSLPQVSFGPQDPLMDDMSKDYKKHVSMVSSRGIKFGTISGSWSYIMLPAGEVMTRTYLFTLTDGSSLQDGDSGAWIMDSFTEKIYGHIVASDTFGRGYVVPITDSFNDIKTQLRAEAVWIPSQDEISAVNRPSVPLEWPSTAPMHQSDHVVDQAIPSRKGRSRRDSIPRRRSFTSGDQYQTDVPVDLSQFCPPTYQKFTVDLVNDAYNGSILPPRGQTDSGYSSMNTTPTQSPPISPPQHISPPEEFSPPENSWRSSRSSRTQGIEVRRSGHVVVPSHHERMMRYADSGYMRPPPPQIIVVDERHERMTRRNLGAEYERAHPRVVAVDEHPETSRDTIAAESDPTGESRAKNFKKRVERIWRR